MHEERFECNYYTLQDLHNELKQAALADTPPDVFPDFDYFLDMSGVEPLWMDAPLITDERWRGALPEIVRNLSEYTSFATKILGKKVAAVLRDVSSKYPDLSTPIKERLNAKVAQLDNNEPVYDYDLDAYRPREPDYEQLLRNFAFVLPLSCGSCTQTGLFPSFLSHDNCLHFDRGRNPLIKQININSKEIAARLVLVDLVGVKDLSSSVEEVQSKLDDVGESFRCGMCIKQLGEESEEGKRRFNWEGIVRSFAAFPHRFHLQLTLHSASQIQHFVAVHPSTSPEKVIKLVEGIKPVDEKKGAPEVDGDELVEH